MSVCLENAELLGFLVFLGIYQPSVDKFTTISEPQLHNTEKINWSGLTSQLPNKAK